MSSHREKGTSLRLNSIAIASNTTKITAASICLLCLLVPFSKVKGKKQKRYCFVLSFSTHFRCPLCSIPFLCASFLSAQVEFCVGYHKWQDIYTYIYQILYFMNLTKIFYEKLVVTPQLLLRSRFTDAFGCLVVRKGDIHMYSVRTSCCYFLFLLALTEPLHT